MLTFSAMAKARTSTSCCSSFSIALNCVGISFGTSDFLHFNAWLCSFPDHPFWKILFCRAWRHSNTSGARHRICVSAGISYDSWIISDLYWKLDVGVGLDGIVEVAHSVPVMADANTEMRPTSGIPMNINTNGKSGLSTFILFFPWWGLLIRFP